MAGKGKVDKGQIVRRRLQVAQLRLSGLTDQRDIAARLGVSQATISGDFRAIDEQWRREYLAQHQQQKALDLARLDALISANWSGATGGEGKYRVGATRVINELLARRAALLGSDAPAKRELSGPDGGPIPYRDVTDLSDDELAAIARRGSSGIASPPSGATEP